MSFIPSHSLPAENRKIILSRRPAGSPAAADFEIHSAPLAAPAEGQFQVRNLYLSPDPAQRGWFANPTMSPLGAVARSLAVGIVTESRAKTIQPGDIVYGFFGWQLYALATPADLLSHIPKPQAPISLYAGMLGMPGVTGYLAITRLAPLAPGQTLLVSTAAGVVGSLVGQLAARAGAAAIGLTGSNDKVTACTTRFGYTHALNYKTANLAEALPALAPSGLTTYFDNTGGPISDIALRNMARFGRIIQCGTAATASWNPPPSGPRPEREILMRALTWSGFSIFDHLPIFNQSVAELTPLLATGLHYDEDITNGLETTPAALESLLAGRNKGKTLVFVG